VESPEWAYPSGSRGQLFSSTFQVKRLQYKLKKVQGHPKGPAQLVAKGEGLRVGGELFNVLSQDSLLSG
jgi:hypothetical protein